MIYLETLASRSCPKNELAYVMCLKRQVLTGEGGSGAGRPGAQLTSCLAHTLSSPGQHRREAALPSCSEAHSHVQFPIELSHLLWLPPADPRDLPRETWFFMLDIFRTNSSYGLNCQ